MKPVILSIVLSLVSAPGALAQTTTPGILAGAGVTVAGANSLETSSSTLAALVEELDRNNPEIKAARREIDMRVARIAPAGAPPDPSLSFGYMGGLLRPPFFPSSANTSGFREFGLSQEMPYPGKLRLQTRVAATDADTARWSSENVRAGLIADLKTMYVEYVSIGRRLEILLRNKERLEQFRQIAESQFRVGRGLQQDILKAQVEISTLLERQAMYVQERDAVRAQLNGLLFRDIDAPLGDRPAYEATAVLPPLDELRALVPDHYPALRRDDRVVDRGEHALSLAKKEVLPDFALNVTSQKYAGDMPWMYGVDFMVRLPVFWQRKQKPMIAEAAAALDSGKRMRDNTLSTATAQVTSEYLAATTSRRLADLYADSILPQARLALESSLASYQVGRLDFLSVLTNFMTVLTYELSYEEQNARAHQALARLEPFTGRVFVH